MIRTPARVSVRGPAAGRRWRAVWLAAGLLSFAGTPSPAPDGGIVWVPEACPERYELAGRADIPASGGFRIFLEAKDARDARFLDVDRGGAAVLGRIEGGRETALAGARTAGGSCEFRIRRAGRALSARVGGTVLRAEDPPGRAGGRLGSLARGGAAVSGLRLLEASFAAIDEDFREAPGGRPRLDAIFGAWRVEPSIEADLDANMHRVAARGEGREALALLSATKDRASAPDFVVRVAVRPTAGTAAAGIAFQASDGKNLRLFRVSGDRAEIVARRDGAEKILADAKAALTRDAWTEMAVAVSADRVRAFLDGAEVLAARDPGLFAGSAGLWALGAGPTWFDDLRVREIDPARPEGEGVSAALRSAREPVESPAADPSAPSAFGDFVEARLPDGTVARRHRLPFFRAATLEFSLASDVAGAWWIEAALLESTPGPEARPESSGAVFRLEQADGEAVVRARIRVGAETAAEGTIPSASLRGARFAADALEGSVRLRLWGRELLSAKAALPASGRMELRASFGAPAVSGLRASGPGLFSDSFVGAPVDWRAGSGRIGVVSRADDPSGEALWLDADPVAFAWLKRPVAGDFEAEFVASPQTRVRFGRTLRLPWVLHASLSKAGAGPGSGYDFLFFGPEGPLEIWRAGRLSASTTLPREPPAAGPEEADKAVAAWRAIRIRRTGRALELSAEGLGSCELKDADPVPGGFLGAGTSGGIVRLARVRVSALGLGEPVEPPIEWKAPASAVSDPRTMAGAAPSAGVAPSRLSPPSLPRPLPSVVVGGVRAPFRSFRSGAEGVVADGGAEGPVLELVERAGRPGDRAIRLRSETQAGSMGATLFEGPIDPRRFPEVRLEYRIPPGVAADLFAVSGASAGRIPFADPEQGGAAAVADGTWRKMALPIPATIRGSPIAWDRIALADGGARTNPAGSW
ncbi:MAG: hypothetical protein AAB215_05500, partial [Planctomycetota bacterium]